MKKIGILTFHRAYNYGAQIQSYSFSKYLTRKLDNVIVEIIDYQSTSERRYYFKDIVRCFLKNGFSQGCKMWIRNRKFKQFTKNLPLSNFRVISNNSKRLFKKISNKYDIIIVGSDAIFNWRLRKFPVPFYLGYKTESKKISYAASIHGLDWKNCSNEEIMYCSTALKDFDYIGVRDENTDNFIKKCSSRLKSFHNCDPSLLLDLNDINYEEIKNKLKGIGIKFDKPIIVVMTADSEIIKPIVDKYKSLCDFVSIYVPNKLINKFLFNLSPIEWAGVFKFATITITEYFHGTLLSLKNLTPVISIDRTNKKNGYIGKIEDILISRMRLTDMYYNYFDLKYEKNYSKIFETINKSFNFYYTNIIKKALDLEVENIDDFCYSLNEIISRG